MEVGQMSCAGITDNHRIHQFIFTFHKLDVMIAYHNPVKYRINETVGKECYIAYCLASLNDGVYIPNFGHNKY